MSGEKASRTANAFTSICLNSPPGEYRAPAPTTNDQYRTNLHNTSHMYPSSFSRSSSSFEKSRGVEIKIKDATPEIYTKRRRRNRMIWIGACVIFLLIALTIALTVAGVVFHWGKETKSACIGEECKAVVKRGLFERDRLIDVFLRGPRNRY